MVIVTALAVGAIVALITIAGDRQLRASTSASSRPRSRFTAPVVLVGLVVAGSIYVSLSGSASIRPTLILLSVGSVSSALFAVLFSGNVTSAAASAKNRRVARIISSVYVILSGGFILTAFQIQTNSYGLLILIVLAVEILVGVVMASLRKLGVF